MKLVVTGIESFRQYFTRGMESIEAAPQVFPQPHEPAQLMRQEKKEYIPQEATRATFGKGIHNQKGQEDAIYTCFSD